MVVSRTKAMIVAETVFKPFVLQEGSRPEAPIQPIRADLTTFLYLERPNQHRTVPMETVNIQGGHAKFDALKKDDIKKLQTSLYCSYNERLPVPVAYQQVVLQIIIVRCLKAATVLQK
ncbi:uncharacterized protein ARMOST_05872 [Armillaria ostoyae]|uniref:Uncharacterized protein n=1 Tax=Armillaria ostoyae TaxID=47428 RepID=A0A284R1F5_ARMOS|nr:uncharacterized protein ARMOST_05872 [Armillaria ostoyae]